MEGNFYIPDCIQLRNDRLVIRPEYENYLFTIPRSEKQINIQYKLKENFPSGFVTRKIKLRMNRIITNFIESIKVGGQYVNCKEKRKLTFVTLTLPSAQMHTDKELNRLALNRFLQNCKRRFGVINYIWRAERQKNGNIHYHILIDNYIHYLRVRKEWNLIMADLGYIQKFQEVHGHSNPNSTDIHALKNIKNVTAYITKYVSKCEEYKEYEALKRNYNAGLIDLDEFENAKAILYKELEKIKINSRVWGCSDALKEVKDFKITECNLSNQFVKDVYNDRKSKIIHQDNCTVIYNSNMKEILSNHERLYKYYNIYFYRLFLRLYYPDKLQRLRSKNNGCITASRPSAARPAASLPLSLFS